MAGYIAMRVMDYEKDKGIDASHKYYKTMLTKYPQFKEDTDAILMSECKEYLIVDLSQNATV